MKELSREINRYLMDLDNCTNERSEFDVLSKLESLLRNTTYELTHTRTGESYFTLATNEMMNDICKYIENFRRENDLPGNDYYHFRMSGNNKSLKMHMDIDERGMAKTSSLEYAVNNFPRFTLFIILGLDSLGEEYIKYNRLLLKSEYEKFMDLRQANPEYFVPFIQSIIYGMKNLQLIKKGQ